MHAVTDVPHVDFAIVGDRRNGVDRLTLAGTLDRSSLPLLEHSVAELSHPGGALVLDLRNLVTVEFEVVRALRAIARRAVHAGWSLYIIHSREHVREMFEGVGAGNVLSADVSADLAPGAGDWAPISLPPFPGQRELDSAPRHRDTPDRRREEVVRLANESHPRSGGGSAMQEMTSPDRDRIPDLRAVPAGAMAQLVVPVGTQIRTCVRCGRSTTFIPDDAAGSWYACTGCGRYA